MHVVACHKKLGEALKSVKGSHSRIFGGKEKQNIEDLMLTRDEALDKHNSDSWRAHLGTYIEQ